jgi:glycosyltransferase involved in cell wall biosynthesis
MVPAISIGIPVHNGANFLAEAIESVRSQSVTDYELLICDDASTDDTPRICQQYLDSRVRYLRFDDRGGQARAFNRCFEQSQGRAFTLLHADDYYLPTMLESRLAQLANYPDAGLVCGAIRKVDVHGSLMSVGRPWPKSGMFPVGGLVEPLLHGCSILYLGLVLRRDRWVPFRTDMTWGHDWDWTLRLAEGNAAYYDDEPRACYRVHEASGTAENLNAARNGAQERQILEEALLRAAKLEPRAPALRRSALRALALRHMYFAEQALLEDRARVARYNVRYAIRADPSMVIRPTTWALWFGSVAGRRLYDAYRRVRHRSLSRELQ